MPRGRVGNLTALASARPSSCWTLVPPHRPRRRPAIGEPTHVDGMPDQLDVAGAAYHTFHQGFLGA